jgi:eukaryotic translation initiation factor 2C
MLDTNWSYFSKGTAKPSHYVVIHDENDFSSDDIQYLTFDLCHLYARSTKSVSIPAPAYYAHLAAKRGRLYENDEE